MPSASDRVLAHDLNAVEPLSARLTRSRETRLDGHARPSGRTSETLGK